MAGRTLMCLAISALLIKLAMAATYTVGGPNGGWDSSTNLQTWSSSQTFLPGDNLVFRYSPNHDVSEVTKSDYDNCMASNSIQAHSDGNTAISLASPGKRYFICGAPGHCSAGMKLEVVTLATSVPTASQAPEVSAPTTTGPPSTAEAPLPSMETPSNGLSPIPPPSSSANKCSFTVAFGFALMMFFAM